MLLTMLKEFDGMVVTIEVVGGQSWFGELCVMEGEDDFIIRLHHPGDITIPARYIVPQHIVSFALDS